MGKSIRYTKEIPYYGHFDVVVLGGGPSGVCAAIEAALLKKNVLRMTLLPSAFNPFL